MEETKAGDININIIRDGLANAVEQEDGSITARFDRTGNRRLIFSPRTYTYIETR